MQMHGCRFWITAIALVLIASYIFVTTFITLQRSEQLWSHMDRVWRQEWYRRNELATDFLNSLNKSQEIGNISKTILYWNSFFNIKHFSFGINRMPFSGCPESNCIVWDKDDGEPPLQVEDFDAVLFHAFYEPGEELLPNKPSTRSAHQRYIFYLYESPGRFKFDFTSVSNFFNWTLTYRRDSDIYSPYGFISNDTTPSKTPIRWLEPKFGNVTRLKTSKTKPIAWLVSDCTSSSKREAYVKELSKFIQVDVFGYCGSYKCKRSKTNECFHMVEDNYMFYLSFENSLCEDYVTEKLFTYIGYKIVPVVYGGAEYKTIAPPMSYIDVRDYSSPEQLADYLQYLIKHPEEYQKYFWWKSYYGVDFRWGKQAMCTLCAMLHDDNLPDRVYSDIDRWWDNGTTCHTPRQHFNNSLWSETLF